jgi:hypothetical protein
MCHPHITSSSPDETKPLVTPPLHPPHRTRRARRRQRHKALRMRRLRTAIRPIRLRHHHTPIRNNNVIQHALEVLQARYRLIIRNLMARLVNPREAEISIPRGRCTKSVYVSHAFHTRAFAYSRTSPYSTPSTRKGVYPAARKAAASVKFAASETASPPNQLQM